MVRLAKNVHPIIGDATFQDCKDRTGWDFSGWDGTDGLVLICSINDRQNQGEHPNMFRYDNT